IEEAVLGNQERTGFGGEVQFEGERIAVNRGACVGNDCLGPASIFERRDGVWTEAQELASVPAGAFGIAGSIAVVHRRSGPSIERSDAGARGWELADGPFPPIDALTPSAFGAPLALDPSGRFVVTAMTSTAQKLVFIALDVGQPCSAASECNTG